MSKYNFFTLLYGEKMTYEIELHKRVEKFLDKHSDKFSISFFEKANILSTNPYDNTLDIKQLKWKNWCRRLRIWKYRFLYEIQENTIIIYFYNADSRWNIY